jgi:hypothetical protein
MWRLGPSHRPPSSNTSSALMSETGARQYPKLEERTRAAARSPAQVPLRSARQSASIPAVVPAPTELCGTLPGRRDWVDSPGMLARRISDCTCEFVQADLAHWTAETELFWQCGVSSGSRSPRFRRLLAALPAGGVLAVQMPDKYPGLAASRSSCVRSWQAGMGRATGGRQRPRADSDTGGLFDLLGSLRAARSAHRP